MRLILLSISLLLSSLAQAGAIQYQQMDRSAVVATDQEYYPGFGFDGCSGGVIPNPAPYPNNICEDSASTITDGVFTADLSLDRLGYLTSYGLSQSSQDSVLAADGISIMASSQLDETQFWSAASSSIDTTFTLTSRTQFRIQGMSRVENSPLGLGGCCANSSLLLETADGSNSILDLGDFSIDSSYDQAAFDALGDLTAWATSLSYTFGNDPEYYNRGWQIIDTTIALGPGTYRLAGETSVLSCNADDLVDHYFCGDYGDRAVSALGIELTVVPVPPALLLFPSALAALGWWRRKGLLGQGR